VRFGFKRLAVCLFATWFLSLPATAGSGDYFIYVGSYTSRGTGGIPNAPSTSKGIYAWRFNPASDSITSLGLVAETINPAYICATPDGRFLYAVNWQTETAEKSDTVSAYAINRETGALNFLNKASAGGGLPNEIVVGPRGKVAVVTNYGFHTRRPAPGTAPAANAAPVENNSSFAALPIEADGRLGEPFYIDHHAGDLSNPRLHGATHGAIFSKDGRFVFVTDLGLNRIYSYQFDADKPSITPFDPPYVSVNARSGPRRLALSPDGRFLYVNHETDSKVSVFRVDGGNLTEIQQISTLRPGFTGKNATAEIQINKNGHFLYVSNRGADDIVLFAVDPVKGMLSTIEFIPALGQSPRNLTMGPTSGYFFASDQDSNNVAVFKADAKTGHLTPTGQQLEVSQPASVFFVKAAQ